MASWGRGAGGHCLVRSHDVFKAFDMSRTKVTVSELAAIERHLNEMIEACESALLKYRLVAKADRNAAIEGAITYWRNVRSGYRHAIAIARQKCDEYARQNKPRV